MSRRLQSGLDVAGNKITSVATGTAATDAVNKAQLDAAVIGGAAASLTGRNRIINGDMSVNQRNLTDVTVNGAYGLDRWYWNYVASGGSHAYGIRQAQSAVLPEGAKQMIGIGLGGVTDQASYITIGQKIEGVRTLSGKSVTVSFYARGDTVNRKIGVQLVRNFGTGGSPSATEHIDVGIVTLSPVDAAMTGVFGRYSVTTTLPAMGAQVEGTNLDSRLTLLLYASCGPNAAGCGTLMPTIGVQNGNIHIWGVQVEEGTQATIFEKKTPGQEMKDCRRYFAVYGVLPGWTDGATQVYAPVFLPDLSSMRTCGKQGWAQSIVVAGTGGTLATNATIQVGGGESSGHDAYAVIPAGQVGGSWVRFNNVQINAEL